MPTIGAGGRINNHRLLGLKHIFQTVQHFVSEFAELRAAVVDGGPVDGA
jgi:hypothetical protein